MSAGFPQGLSQANQEWVIDFCRFRQAWELTKGAGIYVAHPDTGPTNHPELQTPNYERAPELSKNFFDPLLSNFLNPSALAPSTLSPEDPLNGPFPSHGTSIASVLVSPIGHRNVSVQHPETATFAPEHPDAFVTGVAPEATVIPFRVTNSVLLDVNSDLALMRCIYFCIALQTRAQNRRDVAVMSISLGRPLWLCGYEKRVRDALAAATKNGIVICAAAGQLIRNPPPFIEPVFPGSDSNVICVGGCTASKTFDKYDEGFYGPAIDITAPAVDIWRAQSRLASGSQSPEYVVAPSAGTSYAAAIVAGACALWQAHHVREDLKSRYGPAQITKAFKFCLQNSATTPRVWDTRNRGAGVLDAAALLGWPLPSQAELDQMDA